MIEGKIAPVRSFSQNFGLVSGPVLFIAVLLVSRGLGPPASRMAALAALMAVWWITEAIPLFATALLPLIFYPLLGIKSGEATAPLYINSTIFLFVGGFMTALTMGKWNLHKRIALWIIRHIRGGPSFIILGFMAAAAFLSMWISNTATAIMMFPMGLAIVLQMEERFGSDARPFTVGLMLGIAYACSVGGMATPVGTPPNLACREIFENTFPKAGPVSFAQWMMMGVPISAVMLVCIWLVLTRVFYRLPAHLQVDRTVVEEEYRKLGPMLFEEKVILAVFAATACLWLLRTDIDLEFVTLPGWSRLLPYPRLIDDGTVALFMATTLFFVPTRNKAGSPTIMGADVVGKIPWDIVLLFGGGFALAQGFTDTGLSAALGSKLYLFSNLPPLAMIAVVCIIMTFLTELTSNTATTQTVLPILISVAVAMKINPLMLMVPATLSASCAFMMPVATPPNAIVFGCGRLKIADMARAGLVINFIGVAVITALFYLIALPVFSIAPGVFPEWARH